MKTLSYCAKQATAMGDYIIDRDLAAIEPQDSRDELIANIKDEMVERRKAAMDLDDVEAAMQHCSRNMAANIRDALQRKDMHLSLAILQMMFGAWLEFDSEIEAVKSVEQMEGERH